MNLEAFMNSTKLMKVLIVSEAVAPILWLFIGVAFILHVIEEVGKNGR